MSVSGKKPYMPRIKRMTQSQEFFKVGELFWYTPLSDSSVNLLIETVKEPDGFGLGSSVCRKLCRLYDWCENEGNFDSEENSFVPSCIGVEREDNIRVVFKEV